MVRAVLVLAVVCCFGVSACATDSSSPDLPLDEISLRVFSTLDQEQQVTTVVVSLTHEFSPDAFLPISLDKQDELVVVGPDGSEFPLHEAETRSVYQVNIPTSDHEKYYIRLQRSVGDSPEDATVDLTNAIDDFSILPVSGAPE